MGEQELGMGGEHRPGRGALAALLLGVVALGACGGAGELEVVSGPVPGSPPTTATALAPEGPPPTGTPDTIPPTTTSTSTSTTSTTAPPSSSSSTTTTAPDDPAPEPGPGTPSGLPADLAAADASLSFVNARRAENGRGPLTMDVELQADAEEWAHQMSNEQNMYHDPDRGEKMPAQYGWWGENVAMGHDPGGLDQAWWESEGHRANILGESYDAIGIAFVQDGDGTYWAVQIFGGDGQ